MGTQALVLGLLLFGLHSQSAQEAAPEHFTLARLVATQREDGRWALEDLASAPAHEPPCPCTAPEHALDDAGLTSLVLLALLEQGSTPRRGPYRQATAHGVHWLRVEQQAGPGELIGARARDGWLYDHALATLALGEFAKADRNPLIQRSFQRALSALERARIPDSAWGDRAGATAGDEDVYVTALAVCSLELRASGAAEVDAEPDSRYSTDVLAWLDAATDPASGEVPGSHRVQVRAATAAALWTRIQLGRRAGDDPLVARGLQALLERPQMFHDGGCGCELRGPLMGSLAAFSAGNARAWRNWDGHLRPTLDYDLHESPLTARGLVVRVLCASVHQRSMHVLAR